MDDVDLSRAGVSIEQGGSGIGSKTYEDSTLDRIRKEQQERERMRQELLADDGVDE